MELEIKDWISIASIVASLVTATCTALFFYKRQSIYDGDCWAPDGSPIMNFGEMTEKQVFEVVRKTHNYYSSLNEGNKFPIHFNKKIDHKIC